MSEKVLMCDRNSFFCIFYLQHAKKFHPDVNKSDPKAGEKFAEISEAYEVCGIVTLLQFGTLKIKLNSYCIF